MASTEEFISWPSEDGALAGPAHVWIGVEMTDAGSVTPWRVRFVRWGTPFDKDDIEAATRWRAGGYPGRRRIFRVAVLDASAVEEFAVSLTTMPAIGAAKFTINERIH